MDSMDNWALMKSPNDVTLHFLYHILEYKFKNMSVGKFKSVNWFQFHHIKYLDIISGFTTFKYHLKAKCVD